MADNLGLPRSMALKSVMRQHSLEGRFDQSFINSTIFVIPYGVSLIPYNPTADLNLPLDPMVIELQMWKDGFTAFHVLCRQTGGERPEKLENGFFSYLYTWDERERRYSWANWYIAVKHRGGLGMCFDCQTGFQIDFKEVHQEQFTYVTQALTLLSYSAHSLRKFHVPASKRTQRLRKIGKSGWEYRIVSIDAMASTSPGEPSGLSFAHASPRWHLRRGHWRTLQTKKIWVRQCEVGSKKSGGIVHDYAALPINQNGCTK